MTAFMRYRRAFISQARVLISMLQLILNQEISRTGNRGYLDGLLSGVMISLSIILNFGNDELKSKVSAEIFAGEKLSCLAITEAFAGSDVSGLKTYAKKTKDGKHWVINGTKKWITNGT
jgi:alkylation response protein AidB-like acyl-CoA dehydrogenase